MNEVIERLRAANADPLVSLIKLAESDRMPVEQAEALLWKIFAMTTTAVVAPVPEAPKETLAGEEPEEIPEEIPQEFLEREVLDEPAPFGGQQRKKGAHLRPHEINKIKELLVLGLQGAEIARRFNVTRPVIYRIKSLYGL